MEKQTKSHKAREEKGSRRCCKGPRKQLQGSNLALMMPPPPPQLALSFFLTSSKTYNNNERAEIQNWCSSTAVFYKKPQGNPETVTVVHLCMTEKEQESDHFFTDTFLPIVGKFRVGMKPIYLPHCDFSSSSAPFYQHGRQNEGEAAEYRLLFCVTLISP